MRSFAIAAFLAPLVFACGLGVSQSHGTPQPSPPADLPDGGDDAGCGPIPLIACETGCGQYNGGPQCVNGTWACPTFEGSGCPVEVDAGGCAGPAPACPTSCPGQGTQAFCAGDQWTCLDTACAPDASPPPLDASPDPLFACGDSACDPETSYCQIVAGGPVLDDGGTPSAYSCNPLPASCGAGTATCACIAAIEGEGCGCVASGGKVIETCELP
jgi:hypothetical protein